MTKILNIQPEPARLGGKIEKVAAHLARLLAEQYRGVETCTLTLCLKPELGVEKVLKSLQGRFRKKPDQPDVLNQIRETIRQAAPGITESQLERLVDSALHGWGVQIGLSLFSSPLKKMRSAPKIFSCPTCDEVFLDRESLDRHLKTHQ